MKSEMRRKSIFTIVVILHVFKSGLTFADLTQKEKEYVEARAQTNRVLLSSLGSSDKHKAMSEMAIEILSYMRPNGFYHHKDHPINDKDYEDVIELLKASITECELSTSPITNANPPTMEEYRCLVTELNRNPAPKDFIWKHLPEGPLCSKVYGGIDIELPTQEVRQILDNFGVLAHRKPSHDKLIVGCGNMGKIIGITQSVGDDDFRKIYPFYSKETIHNHSHNDVDTIDLYFGVNPTICSNFSNPNLPDALQGHKYREIFFEAIGVPYLPWDIDSYNSYGGEQIPHNGDSQQAARNIFSLLNEDGILVIKTWDLDRLKATLKAKRIQLLKKQITEQSDDEGSLIFLTKSQIEEYLNKLH